MDITDLIATIIFILSFLLFATPGMALYRLYNPRSSFQEIIVIGSPIGLGISSLLFAVIGWLTNINQYVYIFSILAIIFFLWLLRRKYVNSNKILECDDNSIDSTLIYFIIILSTLVIVSYVSFGKETPLGYAFKDLYETDLLHHMSVFIHLSKGIPPTNPYFTGQSWHYYWFAHTLPTFTYIISDYKISPKYLMLLTSVSYTTLFVSAIFLLIRDYYKVRKIVVLLMIMSLLAYGYNDIYVLFKHILLQVPESLNRLFHFDYLISEGGEQYTGYSHSWFRSFLVEPHSTLALSILFITILLVNREGVYLPDYRKTLFRGLLLGLVFSLDAFMGLIVIFWLGVIIIIDAWRKNISMSRIVNNLIWFSAPIAMIFCLLVILEIIPLGSSTLVLKPYYKMIILSPGYFFIDYGPLGILGIFGIYLLFRKNQIEQHWPLVLFAIICLLFMFFVNLADIGSTQMFRKGGLVLRSALVIFSGIALSYILEKYNYKKILILYFMIIIALPTPFVDLYMLSTWKNKSSFVKHEDYEACQWIKHNLPNDIVIQDYPATITKLLAFGERRVAVGDWEHAKTGGVKPEALAMRFNEIRQMFKTEDISLALSVIKKYSIDYIYLNEDYRKQNVKKVNKFDLNKNIFEIVYSRNGVSVYKVNVI